MDSPSKPPEPAADASTAAQPQEAKQEVGNMLDASPTVSAAQKPVLVSPTGQPLARGPDGRLYNPAKGEPPPKAQSAALLNSPKPLQAKDINSGGFPEGGNTDSGISGLDAIPKHWPKLPPNVSLSVEISWVQAERLYVVKEQPGKRTKVDLSNATSPAPSMAALSWLETSIRSYAKFIEVASKTAAASNDEAEFVRKERMAIAEIRSILREMMPEAKG